jgi:hypothetical protein
MKASKSKIKKFKNLFMTNIETNKLCLFIYLKIKIKTISLLRNKFKKQKKIN